MAQQNPTTGINENLMASLSAQLSCKIQPCLPLPAFHVTIQRAIHYLGEEVCQPEEDTFMDPDWSPVMPCVLLANHLDWLREAKLMLGVFLEVIIMDTPDW